MVCIALAQFRLPSWTGLQVYPLPCPKLAAFAVWPPALVAAEQKPQKQRPSRLAAMDVVSELDHKTFARDAGTEARHWATSSIRFAAPSEK